MNFTDNNVTFKDILNAGLQTGGNRIASGAYTTDESGNITKPRLIVNAIDIDWLKAEVPGIDDPITSTGQLLAIIGQIKQAVTNGGTGGNSGEYSTTIDDILQRLSVVEQSIGSGSGTTIPDNLTQQLATITSDIASLKTTVSNHTSTINGLQTIKSKVITKETFESMSANDYDPNTLYFIIGEPDYYIVSDNGGGNSDNPNDPQVTNNLTIISNTQTKQYSSGIVTLKPTIADHIFTISGVLNGQIIIDLSEYSIDDMKSLDTIEIILSGVNITSNEQYGILYKIPEEAIGINGYKKLKVKLSPNTVNIINCVQSNASNNTYGALHSMSKLEISGAGYLTIGNTNGCGIKSILNLEMNGPHIYIESSNDCISCGLFDLSFDSNDLQVKSDICINHAMIYFNNGTNGIKSKGFTIIYSGSFYGNNITNKLIDSTQPGLYTASVKLLGNNTNISNILPLNEENFKTFIQNINTLAAGTGHVYGYVNDASMADENYEPYEYQPIDGKYIINAHECILAVGFINNPIVFNASYFSSGSKKDAKIYLSNTCIISNNLNIATLYFEQDEANKLKIISLKDTYNFILNEYYPDTKPTADRVEADAIKSENNLDLEIRNNSYLYVSSKIGDGLDGGNVIITDSKGSLIISECGMRGIKGNVVVIGPDAIISKSVITNLITEAYIDNLDESSAKPKLKTFDGIAIIKNNCKEYPKGAGSYNSKTTGFADIYCRNGSHTDKGIFATSSTELNGIIIFGSIGAVKSIDFNNSNNIYYNELLTQSIIPAGNIALTSENNFAYNLTKSSVNI